MFFIGPFGPASVARALAGVVGFRPRDRPPPPLSPIPGGLGEIHIVGPPPMEDFYMGKVIERIFLPLMKMQLPEVRDICMPAEGVFHNLILVSMKKSYPGHARKVMHAIWGLGQAMFSKCIVVVDDDVDVQNVAEVAWKALNNIDPQRDIEFVLGPVDSLDHSSRLPNFGSKMGVDATTKWPTEGFTRRWPNVIKMSPEVVSRVDELWKRAGLSSR